MLRKKVRIPHDVVIEILSRLPVESLLRFKCVHKSWYLLIEEDSKFIALQLRNHVPRNDDCFRFLIHYGEEGMCTRDYERKGMISIVRYDGEVVSFLGKDAVMRNVVSYVSGHCDGIVCFYRSIGYAAIANPGIGQFRTLPESCVTYSNYNFDPEETYGRYTFTLGLGSDLRTNDYKVVRIIGITNSETFVSNDLEVEVYSLSSNSWRHIETLDRDIYGFSEDYKSSYWNGAYYWNGFKMIDGIMSFNFSDEVFEFISIPEDASSPNDDGLCLDYGIIEFNSGLAIVAYKDWNFDIWDMNRFLVCGTWTKLISITYQPSLEDGFVPTHVHNVLGVLKKDQLLVLVFGDEQGSDGKKMKVVSYNLVDNQMKILPIGKKFLYDGVGYNKSSLVSIL